MNFDHNAINFKSPKPKYHPGQNESILFTIFMIFFSCEIISAEFVELNKQTTSLYFSCKMNSKHQNKIWHLIYFQQIE